MQTSIWSGRRVFLTGHTGFKGAWLALLLQKAGAKVFGYALPPAERSLYRYANVERAMTEHTVGDVRDPTALAAALSRSGAQIVFHLAAQPLVRDSYADPLRTYSTNVMGVVHLLEAVREQPEVDAVVVVTSDKCYENREWVWPYRESEAMGGFDPYSSSKGCAELVCNSYGRSFFNDPKGARLATGRAGNVIGGGDYSSDRLVPDLVRSFETGAPMVLRNPGAVRPWQHVLDALSGYLALAEHLLRPDGAAYTGGWNFGPDMSSERTVAGVVGAAAEVWGEGASWVLADGSQPHEAHVLKLDSSKAKAHLGWTPSWDFSRTIKQTVDWYRLRSDAQTNMERYTHRQIEDFLVEAERSRPEAS